MKSPPVGAWCALAAAALFGVSTPLAKLLLGHMSPAMLAGLLYLGSGAGLAAWRRLRRHRAEEAPVRAADLPWLAAAIACGGVAAPLLLMAGLASVSAASASLLLNLEGVFTALLAWLVFRENYDARVVLGMLAIVAGGGVLAWRGPGSGGLSWGALAVALACLAWGVDNNLTRRVSARDPVQIAMVKGLAAGTVNLGIAMAAGQALPAAGVVGLALFVGLFSYGMSLTLFVLALRHLGTARTSAYFSVAPFVGVAVAVAALGEPLTGAVAAAGILMALGVWLHLTEHHAHDHRHEAVVHDHIHRHDDAHHAHDHEGAAADGHNHVHVHAELMHSHPHFPDTHHHHAH